jgi:glycosyltransferase involved in cell wall biosynthesis
MSLIIGMLVKNEANRWLSETIRALNCDHLIVLDDASSDNTIEICKSLRAEVHRSLTSLWETNEYAQRHRLLELCLEKAGRDDWLGIIDADEILDGAPFKNFNIGPDADYVGIPLYDMWNATHFRDDERWNAHKRYWPIFARANKRLLTSWTDGGRLHCGRFPIAQAIGRDNIARTNLLRVMHMGWSTPKDRYKKFMRYMKIDGAGKYGSLPQYLSIMDPEPVLKDYEKETKDLWTGVRKYEGESTK